MMTLQIAGQTLKYRDAPDLNQKIRALVDELRLQRTTLDKESKKLRKDERALQRFLGGRSGNDVDVVEARTAGQ